MKQFRMYVKEAKFIGRVKGWQKIDIFNYVNTELILWQDWKSKHNF